MKPIFQSLLALLLVLVMSASSLGASGAKAQPTVDPKFGLDGEGLCPGMTGGYCQAKMISTGRPNDLVVVQLICFRNDPTDTACTDSITTISDSAGLHWTQRDKYCPLGTNFGLGCVTDYYAVARGMLRQDTVTMTSNAQAMLIMGLFAVSGVDLNHPFDRDMPATVACSDPNACSISFTTASMSKQELVFVGVPINDMGGCFSPGSEGWKTLDNWNDGWGEMNYKIINTGQGTRYTFTCNGITPGDTEPIMIFVDGIQSMMKAQGRVPVQTVLS